ncbi:MAG: transglycosylase domain-containing protein [Candidatus Gracilibacteria bacterium]|jgi:penicillin-binding protein 1A
MFEKIKFHIQKIGKKTNGKFARMRERARLPNGKLDWKQILLWTGLSIIGFILFLVLSLGIAIAVLSITLPDVHDLDKLNQAQATTIYDREGNILYVKGAENREYVTYDKISSSLVNATIAIEDTQYWEHPGFDIRGIGRAVVNDIFHFSLTQGGSTITQQYIKLAFLNSEKSYIRKLKELILSVQLEQAFDKKKIIELYLNKISYSNKAYGIEKAAQIYFNKHAINLDLAESAILASIPNRPSYYSQHQFSTLAKQFTSDELASRNIRSQNDLYENEYAEGIIGKTVQIDPNNPDKQIYLAGRSDIILSRMMELGYINEQQKQEAWTKMQKNQFTKYQSKITAPHFVMYIIDQLEQKYGKDIVEQGGLKVYTTLDPKMEEIAEKAVLDGSKSNEKAYNAKNAALISMDPKTGQILAMVGSRDYFDPNYDGNENVITDFRQPGSSFKPFVYAQVFLNRFAPASPVFDTPMKLGTDPNKYPKNFDGTFRGPMTIRSALAQSRNIPAIKAFFAAGQQEPIVALTQKMGIVFQELQSDPNHQYGYPLAIGAAGVRPLDMATAYSVFANGGIHHDPVSILKIENSKGEILEEAKQDDPGEQALDPQVAYMINSILSDTSVRLSPTMTIPGQVNGAKTGTSNGFDVKPNGQKIYYPKDLWIMGYTTRVVTAVWVGNNNDKVDGHMSLAADGTNAAAPIWKSFMTQALKDTPSEDFPIPEGIKQVAVSKASGKLPGPNTPPDQIITDFFANFSIPTEVDDSYAQVNVDRLCNGLATEFTPPEMVQVANYRNVVDLFPNNDWIQSAQAWVQQHASNINQNSTAFFGAPPTTPCPEHNANSMAQKPSITLLSPASGSSYPVNSNIPVNAQVSITGEFDRVEYYLDNELKYKTNTAPYNGEIRLPFGETGGIHHTITAKAFDKLGYEGNSSIDIVTTDNGQNQANLPQPPTPQTQVGLPPIPNTQDQLGFPILNPAPIIKLEN